MTLRPATTLTYLSYALLPVLCSSPSDLLLLLLLLLRFTGNEVGGPLSVVKAGSEMAQYSPVALIGFMATLSVNLAILNSLPFPALDGGQLSFVIIEMLAGRPVPRKIQDTITAVAFSFLLALGASTVVGDLSKVGEPMLQSEVMRTVSENPNNDRFK
jgi:RIP metalloprotease RseP